MLETCPSDGYPMEVSRGYFGTPAPQCTNPWHPTRLPPCPACGSTARPDESTSGPRYFGAPHLAACVECHEEWDPRAPV